MMDSALSMEAFARHHILTRENLGRQKTFPSDLWTAMGQKGLLDSETITGQGRASNPCTTLARTARAMAGTGGNLGLTLSWIIHHLTAHYILAVHHPDQFARHEQALKTGATTFSFAVSEPGAGGHPKFMTARADENDQGFILSGEKTYLTNGPIARGFIVVAITGIQNKKKEFSAFFLDRDTPGLIVSDPMDIPFFNPSPHGGIIMENCHVDKKMMIGEKGKAFFELVLPFRKIEDALMTGAVCGAMDFLLKTAAKAIAPVRPESEILESLGRLETMVQTADLISERMTGMVDQKKGGRSGLHLYFRQMASEFTTGIDTLLEAGKIQLSEPGRTLAHDLKSSAAVGKNIGGLKLQKLGRKLIQTLS